MRPAKTVSVIRKGDYLDEADDNEVDYEIPSFSRIFGSHISTIPVQNAVSASRLFYGARFINQALPMKNRETPWVQNMDEDGDSFDNKYGRHVGALQSEDDGDVESIKDNKLTLRLPDGTKKTINAFKDFPFNRKTGLTQSFTVKPGDKVTRGKLLATSNYTDANGGLALGLNTRVAVVPYKAWTIDDAGAVSESFAKRATSEHMYGFEVEQDEDTKIEKNHYISLFATNFTKPQIDTVGDDGVVKPGTVLKKGDPIILATKPKTVNGAEQLGRLSKSMLQARRNSATTWEKDVDGIVTDVAYTKNGPVVYVKAEEPLKQGDKVVLRQGQKGVISKIIPDAEMPRTADGQPLDMLLNPLSLYSRINAATPYEILLGKVAKATGQPIKVPGALPAGTTWLSFVREQLAKHGIPEKEKIFDPILGKYLRRPVMVGDAYLLKLHHTSASKLSDRGQGSYTVDQQPAKGGGEMAQAKRFSGLENYGLLSVGAPNIQRENTLIRGQRQDEFWKAIRAGQTPAEPGAPFVWHKYTALLNSAGLHAADKGGGVLRLGPMTDRELDSRKPLEIKHADALDLHSPNLDPIPGGPFDQALVATNKWGYVSLPQPIVNPAFSGIVRKMLGLTENQFRDIMAGKAQLESR